MRTLHHFDQTGLFKPLARSAGGYRPTGCDDVVRLRGIQALRHLGLPLKQIAEMLAGDGADLPAIVARQVRALDPEIRQATDLRGRLQLMLDGYAGGGQPDMADWLGSLALMATCARFFNPDEIRTIAGNWRSSETEWLAPLPKGKAMMARGLLPTDPVLRLTGDSLALGWMLALLGLPRAGFILLGSAVVDRFSPQREMTLSKQVCTALLPTLAALVLLDALTLRRIGLLAFGIGLATAFSIPAGTSMLPLVAPARLQAANSLLMGLRQLSLVIGALRAALLITVLGDSGRAPAAGTVTDPRGLGLVFKQEALSCAFSARTLWRVRFAPPAVSAALSLVARPAQPVLAAEAEGRRCFWRDQPLRTCLLYGSAVALLITGLVQIALPGLAASQPRLGAAALGSLLAALGAGTLAGMVVSGARPRLRWVNLGMTILVVDALVGLLFMLSGDIGARWRGVALLLAIGLLGGYLQVTVFTWIQRRVAPAMLGRAMSVFLIIFMGLAPLSSTATGWLLRWRALPSLFAAAGGALLACPLLALARSPMRRVSDDLPASAAVDV